MESDLKPHRLAHKFADGRLVGRMMQEVDGDFETLMPTRIVGVRVEDGSFILEGKDYSGRVALDYMGYGDHDGALAIFALGCNLCWRIFKDEPQT